MANSHAPSFCWFCWFCCGLGRDTETGCSCILAPVRIPVPEGEFVARLGRIRGDWVARCDVACPLRGACWTAMRSSLPRCAVGCVEIGGNVESLFETVASALAGLG